MTEEGEGACAGGEADIREVLVVEHRLGPIGNEDISPRDYGEEDSCDYSSCFQPSSTIEQINEEVFAERARQREEARGRSANASVSEYRNRQPRKPPPQSNCCLLL